MSDFKEMNPDLPGDDPRLNNAFFGGMIHGICSYPRTILRGVQGQTHEGAKITSEVMDRSYSLYKRSKFPPNSLKIISDTYLLLPRPLKENLDLGILNFSGNVTGSFVCSVLTTTFLSRAIGMRAASKMGPMHLIPATRAASILVGGLVTYFSFVSHTRDLSDGITELYKYEGVKDAIEDTIEELSEPSIKALPPGNNKSSPEES